MSDQEPSASGPWASGAEAAGLGDEELGLHVDDPDLELTLDDGDEVAERDTDVVDALAEAFNARDLDAVLDVVAEDAETPGLLGGDRDDLPAALEDLWHRRPAACLTRGRIEDTVVGVLWEHDGSGWWALATVHIGDVDEEGLIGVLEFSEDASLLDEVAVEPPDHDLEEGSRWVEWEEGAD